MKIHEMKLLKHPYTEIKAGRKNVEMRLYDEKRKNISVGDKIIFACADFEGEYIEALVRGICVYKDFSALVASYAPRELGFEGFSAEYIEDYMTKIYGREAAEKHGAFAILIALEK